MPDSAGQIISDQILREQDWEQDRARSLEEKAWRLMTLSIAFLGLLASAIRLDNDFAIDGPWTKELGIVGVALLSGSALAAVAVLIPRSYERPMDGSFETYLAEQNIAVRDASYSARRVWQAQNAALAGTRKAHGKKAWWLIGAMVLVVAGTVALVAAVLVASL